MKRILLIILILSVGLSQKLTQVVETYQNGNVYRITSHKETLNRIEKVEYVEYYENGKKKKEVTYKDGEMHGLANSWHENGQKSEVLTFKNGLPEGNYNEWHENGQKERKATYKDGKKHGLLARWHENGQKSGEATYKDDELVSSKCWDKEGYECECNPWGMGCK